MVHFIVVRSRTSVVLRTESPSATPPVTRKRLALEITADEIVL